MEKISERNKPDFKRLYEDLINTKYPDKKKSVDKILNKEKLIDYDLINLNKSLFGDKKHNQRLKSYDKETIIKILDYQKKNELNNTELALYFNLSRNTIIRWKKNLDKISLYK